MKPQFFVLLILCNQAVAQEVNPQLLFALPGSVEWMSFEEAIDASKINGKKIFVFGTNSLYQESWPGVMESETLQCPRIFNYLNDSYNSVYLDVRVPHQTNYPDGQVYNQHTLSRHLNGEGSYYFPFISILDKDLQILETQKGYFNANDLELMLEYYGNDINKDQSIQEYISKESFSSSDHDIDYIYDIRKNYPFREMVEIMGKLLSGDIESAKQDLKNSNNLLNVVAEDRGVFTTELPSSNEFEVSFVYDLQPSEERVSVITRSINAYAGVAQNEGIQIEVFDKDYSIDWIIDGRGIRALFKTIKPDEAPKIGTEIIQNLEKHAKIDSIALHAIRED